MKNQKGISALLSVFIIIILLVGTSILYLKQSEKQSSGTGNTGATNKYSNSNSENKVTSQNDVKNDSKQTSNSADRWNEFVHPVAGYKLKYPDNWIQEPDTYTTRGFKEFTIRSSDYQMSDGYPVLERGAEFSIMVAETEFKSAEEAFNNSLSKEISFDKRYTTVDNLSAIQYDFSYEGVRAVMTEFVENGYRYVIRYRFVDNQSRSTYWEDYIKLLESFETE